MPHQQRTILIVDDNEQQRAIFQRYLALDQTTYICHQATTAAHGLELCRTLRPDVVLFNERMPDDTGPRFLTALLAEHGPLAFALILLTSSPTAIALQALKLGAHEYLIKEYDLPQRLVLAITSAIERVELQRQVQAEQQTHEQFVQQIWEAASDAMVLSDEAGIVLNVNQAYCQLYGFRAEQVIGNNFALIFPPEQRTWANQQYQAIIQARTLIPAYESTIQRANGEQRTVESRVSFVTTRSGQVALLSIVRDVSAYKQIEQQLAFLAQASQSLTTSLDYRVTLERFARSVIPYLGDACLIDLVDDGIVTDTIAAHSDPEQQALLQEISRSYPPNLKSAHPVATVLRTRQPSLESRIPQELIDQLTASEDHALLQRVSPQSYLMVPLIVRERSIGVIALYAIHAPRQYSISDRQVLEELAQRAAIALDNARLYEEATDAVRERDAFLAIASHEIRNPLTAVLGRAQMLQRRLSCQEERSRDSIDVAVIVEAGTQINQLLSELLEASQGGQQLFIRSVALNLNTLVQQVVAQTQLAAPSHTIVISELTPDITIAGDPKRLEQVLNNLLGNAIKYSPAGGPIEVELTSQGSYAQISISDHGIGIPADALPHIFKRFYRVPGTATNQIAGSGIGLYIVREIVASHGGLVNVRSSEGLGSTFTVQLPLEHPRSN